MTAQGHNLQVIPGSQSVRLYTVVVDGRIGDGAWAWYRRSHWAVELFPLKSLRGFLPGPRRKAWWVLRSLTPPPQHLLPLPFYLT